MICEDCKNLLIQFHMFAETVRSSESLFKKEDSANLMRTKAFLDDTEDKEDVYCIKYNRCLTLVPESKRKFMEIFQLWQPEVIMEAVSEHHNRKNMIKEEAKIDIEEEPKPVKREIQVINEVDDSPLVEALIDENSCEMTEEEWVQEELQNSLIGQDNNGHMVYSWNCLHCPATSEKILFTSSHEFRNHLTTAHIQREVDTLEDTEQSVFIENSIECDWEEDITMQDDILESQPHTEIEQNFYCSKCGFSSSDPDGFAKHQLTHNVGQDNDDKRNQSRPGKLSCSECNYYWTSVAHIKAHQNGHKLFELMAPHLIYPVCSVCNQMFCDEKYYRNHYKQHNNEHIEVSPAVGFFLKNGIAMPSENQIEFHDSPDSIRCGHCLRSFSTEISCRVHQMLFHISMLICPKDNREFQGNQAYTIHLKNNHPELFPDFQFECSVCHLPFSTFHEKLKHMKICQKKSYGCHHCEKRFSQNCHLLKHLKMVSGQLSIECEICKKVCRDKGDYQIHMRSHSEDKAFPCSLCNKSYKTSSARAAHVETHLEPVICPHCPTTFKSRRTFQKHCKTKHSKLISKMPAYDEDV